MRRMNTSVALGSGLAFVDGRPIAVMSVPSLTFRSRAFVSMRAVGIANTLRLGTGCFRGVSRRDVAGYCVGKSSEDSGVSYYELGVSLGDGEGVYNYMTEQVNYDGSIIIYPLNVVKVSELGKLIWFEDSFHSLLHLHKPSTTETWWILLRSELNGKVRKLLLSDFPTAKGKPPYFNRLVLVAKDDEDAKTELGQLTSEVSMTSKDESEVYEATQLKSSLKNIEVLKEKVGEEKERREGAASEVLRMEFQLKVTQLEDELSAWNSMMKEVPGLSCATGIPLKYASLKKEVVDSMMKEGDAQSCLKQMEGDLDAAKLDQQKAEATAMAKEQVQLSTSDVKRMEFMISFVTEERDRLKKTVDDLRKQSNDEVGAESSQTVIQLGLDDFSSNSMKVLRMVNTLTDDNEAKQMIEALKNELQRTKEKLQTVEELKKQSGSGAVTLDDSCVSGKIIQLKEQIATLEKCEERYNTVFADRISVFRRTCCELFGYKITMDDHQRVDENGIPVTRLTLQSIFWVMRSWNLNMNAFWEIATREITTTRNLRYLVSSKAV